MRESRLLAFSRLDDALADLRRGLARPVAGNFPEFHRRHFHVQINPVQQRPRNHIAGQLLRSGTSPLPNHGEAQAAESRKDFVHKLKICHKELRESRRWLRLIQRVPLLKAALVEPLVDETEELIRIFAASLRTAGTRKSAEALLRVKN